MQKDLVHIGDILGSLRVTKLEKHGSHWRVFALCECGKEINVRVSDWLKRNTPNCGDKVEHVDLSKIGAKYKKLTIIGCERINKEKVYKCECKCGNIIYMEIYRWGKVSSCFKCISEYLKYLNGRTLSQVSKKYNISNTYLAVLVRNGIRNDKSFEFFSGLGIRQKIYVIKKLWGCKHSLRGSIKDIPFSKEEKELSW